MNFLQRYLSYIGFFAGLFAGIIIDWQKLLAVAFYALVGGAAGELGKMLITRRNKKRSK